LVATLKASFTDTIYRVFIILNWTICYIASST
jgi:hypothetical protein